MLIYAHSGFVLGFGDIHTSFSIHQQQKYTRYSSVQLIECFPFSEFTSRLHLQALIKSDQVHDTTGLVITRQNYTKIHPFTEPADYLITNIPAVGLSIATADCIPISIYDPINHALGIAHAGWRGSAHRIASTMLHAMTEQYGTQPEQCLVVLGPHAQSCCYQVDAAFVDQLAAVSPYTQQVVQKRNQLFYVDLTLLTLLDLYSTGVNPKSCLNTYAFCTIKNTGYCSYRRQKDLGLRQLTVAALQ